MTAPIKRSASFVESSPKRARHATSSATISKMPHTHFAIVAQYLDAFRDTAQLASTCRFFKKKVTKLRRSQREISSRCRNLFAIPSFLGEFTRLQKVFIHDSNLSKIPPFPPRLTHLHFTTNHSPLDLPKSPHTQQHSLNDLDLELPLASFTQLMSLKINCTRYIRFVDSLHFLKMQNLETIEMTNIAINMKGHFPSSLKNIKLSKCHSEKNLFSSPENLERFHIENCRYPLSNHFLSRLVHVKDFHLEGNFMPPSDDFLLGMLELEKLSLNIPLLSIANLQSDQISLLNLDGSHIRNLPNALKLGKLQDCSIIGAPIHDLSPLAFSPFLRRLNISGSSVTSLAPLTHLQNIEVFLCVDTRISSLAPIANWKRLKKLKLMKVSSLESSNGEAILQPLAHLKELNWVHLGESKVGDLSPLAHLPIQWLNLFKTTFKNVESLANLPLKKLIHARYSTRTLKSLYRIKSIIVERPIATF